MAKCILCIKLCFFYVKYWPEDDLNVGPNTLPYILSKGKGHPTTGLDRPRGSGSVKVPDFLDVRHYERGRSSALRTGRLYPRRNPWYPFSEYESTPGHMVPSLEATEKIPSDTTGNRSRHRPTSSAVP
jgi:hypothetical protein